jgi:hypothetical protein
MNRKTVLFFEILTTLSVLGLMINPPQTVMSQNNASANTYETWTFPAYDLENFTIIVLPDTQYYSEGNPHIFENQTQWIVDNIDELNIVFVSHLGDLVDEWYTKDQWTVANSSMSKLDGKVPWGVSLGNHDGLYKEPDNFEIYFGRKRFENENWYGGNYGDGNQNSYQLFSAGADDYLVLHIQYDPTDDMLNWANSVIDSYPSRRVIVSTHEYLDWWWNPWRSPIGQNIYEKLVKPHADQIFLVVCGHYDYVAATAQVIDGNVVYEMISDYQEQPNGGNGWLKILEFSPLQNKIFVTTYSPYLNQFSQAENSTLTLDYNMTQTNPEITVRLTNSSLQYFKADVPEEEINITVSGEVGTTGFCNVTFPKELNLGNEWTTHIDGLLSNGFIQHESELPWSDYYENATHQTLIFKYAHTEPSHQISFVGVGTIPEFPSQSFLVLSAAMAVVALIFYRKRTVSLH